MIFSYDKRADVMYIALEVRAPSSYLVTENEAGDVLKVDPDTKQVVGCTIPGFMGRLKNGKLIIPEIGASSFTEMAEVHHASQGAS